MDRKISKVTLLSIFFVGMLLIVTGILYSSFALVTPIQSISFTSEKLDYSKKEPGSWKVEKSAKWISKGKARITFDVDTILKTEDKNTDIIFVLDISGSMNGEKLEKVKQDSIELVNTLLSDSNNQAALITFDTGSEILSDFTSDGDILVNIINNISTKGSTNYYQALVNVDQILKNYTPSENRNTIVLFLTDGYPNEDVPNEETQYQYLKQQYPYLVINGIQYEMGSEFLEPIKKVSDSQYIADMKTLSNVLFDASIMAVPYEKFVLTDYIDRDNFTVESVNDIKVSDGKVDFDPEEQKVTWTIESLRTESKPNMTIDVIQKEESKSKELLPTNKKETVVSKIDTIEENITSDKTPILKEHYQVIYEGNVPDGCTISNIPSTKSYNVFDVVEIENNKPTCEGYQFKEWRILDNKVKRINSDYFEMPESDVVIRAEWTNLSLTKSMNGEVHVYISPILQKIGSYDYDEQLWKYKDSITKVVFQNTIESVPGATETFDISDEKNYGVVGYLVPNTYNTTNVSEEKNYGAVEYILDPINMGYTAYIQGDGGVIANVDSSYLFYDFSQLTTIDGLEYLDTANVTNMSYMFDGCSSLPDINLGDFDTTNVTNMYRMFNDCSSLTSLDLSNFDTTNVTNMSSMFNYCKSLTSLDVSNFNTANVTNMYQMFYTCSALTNLDLSNFDTKNVTNMGYMFDYCSSLKSLNLSGFNTSNVTSMSSMFYYCRSLPSLDLSSFNTFNVTSMSSMFYYCSSLSSLDLSSFNTFNVTSMNSMFSNCSSLASLDVSNFDTSSVTLMRSMFQNCSSLPSLDLSNFDTKNVTDMSYMFSGTRMQTYMSLTDLNLSNFNTSNVKNMENMFMNCAHLKTLDVSSFDTSNVKSMESMFYYCSALTGLDVSHFDTSNVQIMHEMFAYCARISIIDLSNFDTSNVTDMSYMFNYCQYLQNLDLSNFNTSNVTDMSGMFSDCEKLSNLDLSSFDTSNVTDMGSMFSGARILTTTITILNPDTKDYKYMFQKAAIAGVGITVNYIETTSELVDKMIATRSWTTPNFSTVIKGVQVPEYNITITGNDGIVSNTATAYTNQTITLSSVSGNYFVTSFKMNGTLVSGNQFMMPDIDVTITDIEVVEGTIIESEHNPYPNSLNSKVYGEKTFEGATSLTVLLDYQTQGTSYDWIYLYDSSGTQYGKYGGTTRKTETITIPGNYIKVVFQTNSSGNNYYGFKATVVPNYD